MDRLKAASLNETAAQAAGKYIDSKFKGGADVEKSLVLNCHAHGFACGARFCEEVNNRGWISRQWNSIKGTFQGEPESVSEEYGCVWGSWIEWHAPRAAAEYIKKKGYRRLSFTEMAFVKASFCIGFNAGYLWRWGRPAGVNSGSGQ